MTTVFYGDNHVLSRKSFLSEQENCRQKNWEIIKLEGKTLDLTNLTQALESRSLFQKDRAVFIENIFSLPKSTQKDKLFSLLVNNCDSSVFIWENKDLTQAQIKDFQKGFSFQQFRVPAVIFKFLDGLSPGKTKNNLDNFHLCLLNDDPEMIFQMLVRQLRLLLLAKEGEKYLVGPSWQKAKFISQAKFFPTPLLIKTYQKLLEIDFQQKTSQSGYDLAASLDLLLSEI